MKRKYLSWLVFGLWVFFCVGCGVKAYPRHPEQEPLSAVSDLKYRIENDTIMLTWSVPETKSPTEAIHCVVYRSTLKPDEASCEKCPITYERIAQVSLGKATKDKAGKLQMNYSTPVKPGVRYRYKINLKQESGPEGDDSNIVTVSQ